MKISEKMGLNKSQLELDFFDYDIDRFWADFENPNVKPSTLKRHILRISKLLEDYKAKYAI
mgnify:CR=1 FL=1